MVWYTVHRFPLQNSTSDPFRVYKLIAKESIKWLLSDHQNLEVNMYLHGTQCTRPVAKILVRFVYELASELQGHFNGGAQQDPIWPWHVPILKSNYDMCTPCIQPVEKRSFIWLCGYLLFNLAFQGHSMSLKAKCKSSAGIHTCDFVLVFNSNIWHNPAPLRDISISPGSNEKFSK